MVNYGRHGKRDAWKQGFHVFFPAEIPGKGIPPDPGSRQIREYMFRARFFPAIRYEGDGRPEKTGRDAEPLKMADKDGIATRSRAWLSFCLAVCLLALVWPRKAAAAVPRLHTSVDLRDYQGLASAFFGVMEGMEAWTGFSGVAAIAMDTLPFLRSEYLGKGSIGPDSCQGRMRFPLASISKQFTGYVIRKMAQEGLLSESDPIERYVPELKGCRLGGISIARLLAHTSGLPSNPPWYRMVGAQLRRGRIAGDSDLIRVLRKTRLSKSPVPGYIYSDLGYALLRLVAVRISGKNWEACLRDRVFLPLGMSRSGLQVPGIPAACLSPGYELFRMPGKSGFFKMPLPEWNYTLLYGASGVFATLDDMLLWGRELLVVARNPGRLPGFLQAGPGGYASGLMSERASNGDSIFYHDGFVPGHRAFMCIYPAGRLFAVVLSNTTGSAKSYDFSRELANLLAGKPYRAFPAGIPSP